MSFQSSHLLAYMTYEQPDRLSIDAATIYNINIPKQCQVQELYHVSSTK
jgi:hypothetical protein